MKRGNSRLLSVLAVGLLAALGVGLFHLMRWAVGAAGVTPPGIVLVCTAALVAVLMLALVLRVLEGRASELTQRAERARVYGQFLGAWAGALGGPREDRAQARQELRMAEQRLLLWASSGLLRSYAAARDLRETPASRSERWAVERVIKAMRADVGRATVGVGEGELLNLLLGESTRGAP